MSVLPTRIERQGESSIQIGWSDGSVRSYATSELRERCPCATCREKRSASAHQSTGLQILPIEETQPLKIIGMKPVGNYAYSIAFSDGHDTGIFPFELLQEIGEATPASEHK